MYTNAFFDLNLSYTFLDKTESYTWTKFFFFFGPVQQKEN